MKIGLVIDDSLDSTDGVQQYVRCVGEWMRERGHQVHYLAGSTVRTDIENIHSLSRNMKVRFNGNQLSIPLPANQGKLRRLVARLELDILHVQVPYSPFLAGKLIRVVGPNVAVVGTFHILPYSRLAQFASNVLGKINTATAQRFDALMAVSEPTQVFAGRFFGFTSIVVANPFHHDAFSVARRGKPAKHAVRRIVYLGRLVERKGPFELVRAVAEIERQNLTSTPYEVIIAGKGFLRPKLEQFTRDNKITDKVIFPGFVDESEKAKLLASGDIVVFPSTTGESFGISLLEGMAASRGVVLAGDNLGYASVVADKKQLFNPRDTAAFARLLARWIDDDTGRLTMAKKQQSYVKQFDVDVIGPKIEDLYAHALQKRRQS
ncbi:glycosyltransferase family 4 protein [Candidatus Saccharibacteria bacterium]|nr:MAG: glycosyltransferase family 4 protein [Candidatus Saccharibacteria bacterium]